MREAGTLQSMLAMTLSATSMQPEARSAKGGAFELISQARAGDMAAFDELMRRHERMVLMTALRFLNGNVADAQDAAQIVFIRLHRSLGQFRDTSSFPAWLYRMTVNVCHDMNRKTRRRAEVDLDSIVRTAMAVVEVAAPDSEWQMQAVQAGLERLGEKERAAIMLRDIEGLATAEVAEILGSSEATIRSQISVGRRKIRKFVETWLGKKRQGGGHELR